MQGKLIVLEGIDGSGKSTQYEKLCRRLENEGIKLRHIIFPRYSNESSAYKDYLGGNRDKTTDVNRMPLPRFLPSTDTPLIRQTGWIII
jgi:dTMP kinase